MGWWQIRIDSVSIGFMLDCCWSIMAFLLRLFIMVAQNGGHKSLTPKRGTFFGLLHL